MFRRRIQLSRHQWLSILLFVGVGLVVFEGYAMSKCIAARQWPTASGEITESYERMSSSWSPRRRNGGLVLHYSYRFNGKRYSSDQIDFGGLARFVSFNRSSIVAMYPKGKRVTVFVNPDEPSQAVLEKEFPLSGVLGLGIGVSMAIICAGMLFVPLTNANSE